MAMIEMALFNADISVLSVLYVIRKEAQSIPDDVLSRALLLHLCTQSTNILDEKCQLLL